MVTMIYPCPERLKTHARLTNKWEDGDSDNDSIPSIGSNNEEDKLAGDIVSGLTDSLMQLEVIEIGERWHAVS